MIDYIFKPKGSRVWRWKFRQSPADGAVIDVSLETSDKRVAERRQAQWREERQQETAGLIPAKAVREAAQRPLGAHLDDFLGDMRRRGKTVKYLANLEFRVGRLIADCCWKLAKDVTADSFQAWLRGQGDLKDKTANDYLEAGRCFFNWMIKVGRTGSNPLRGIDKVKTKEGAAQERRALSDEEMARLLAVAGERNVVYLMAAHTGLRRSEMAALVWGDVHLNEAIPFVRVRASTTKNGKSIEMRLHPELEKALREVKAQGGSDDSAIFARVPRVERFRRDLKSAGIAFKDAFGRSTDFHSLRKTFGTNMARAGVASRVAMSLMRHSDRRLTDKIYTDEKLLDTSGAFDLLPNLGAPASQGASQILVADGHFKSSGVTTSGGVGINKTAAIIGQSPDPSSAVTVGQKVKNGGSGGARTRNLCRDRAAL